MYIFVESNNKLTLDTQELSPFAIIAGGVVLVSLFLFMYSSDMVEIPGQSKSAQTNSAQTTASQEVAKTEVDVTKESKPLVKMEVTTQGYEPNVIRVKNGVPVELEIKNPLDSSNCISTFMIPDFDINNVNLKTGITKLTFTPDKTGEYTFSCGMQMFKGTIIVE